MSHFVRYALISALVILHAPGCPTHGQGDYYQLTLGNTWEFFVRNSELVDERWTLSVLDSDDNLQGSRGELYVELETTYKDATNPSIEYSEFRRRFNVSADRGGLGEDVEPIAWLYKQVNNDEGDRNESFVVRPGEESDWEQAWEYEVRGDGGGSDFEYAVRCVYFDGVITTSLGEFEDTMHIERVRTTTSSSGGEDQVLTNVREEWYAPDVGLVQYRETGSDGLSVEGVLRTTNFYSAAD